jgi:hypothetical protein
MIYQLGSGVTAAPHSREIALSDACSTVYWAMAVRAGKRDLAMVSARVTVPQRMIADARIPVKNFIYSYLFVKLNIIILIMQVI